MDEQEDIIRHFHQILEEALKQANREVIGPMLPPLNVQAILPITIMVAKLRGHYLKVAFDIVENKKDGLPSEEQISELRSLREAYEEVMAVSQALGHAVARGYLELAPES